MSIIFQLLFNIRFLKLEDWRIDRAANCLLLRITSFHNVGHCPLCGQASLRIHSYYQRTVADLPWAMFSVLLQLKVHKFFCDNGGCERGIFTERLPGFVAPWARRTQRLADRLTAIGLALGGAAGVRLSQRLGIGVCRNTLLRLVRRIPMFTLSPPKIVGVDDFAFRKRHTYGTIVIDHEQHQPIALLENREASTLAQWLKDHPGIEILTRDRSNTYAEGIRQGAPDAVQVADRFHLLQNMAETLIAVLVNHSPAIEAVNEAHRQAPMVLEDGSPVVMIPPPPVAATTQTLTEQRRANRLVRFEQVWELHRQGRTHQAIADHLGISHRTVCRYLRSENFPERQPRSDRGRSRLDSYKAYLRDRWNEGCHNAQRLWQELKECGYRGSYTTVADYVRRFRQAQRIGSQPSGGAQVVEPKLSVLTARGVAWWVMKPPDRRDPEQVQQINQLKAQNTELANAIELAQDFVELVRHRRSDQLDPWLERAASSLSAPLRNFAKGLKSDYEAVKAAVTLEWSNGATEGHINRLKMIKRTMFGRAKLDLLGQRFLMPA